MGVLQQFFTDWEIKIMNTIEKAVLDGMKKTESDIKEIIKEYMINRSIQEYYDEYPVSKYDRQYSLFDAFEVNVSVSGYGVSYSIEPTPDNLPPHFSKSKYHQSGDVWRSRNGLPVFSAGQNKYVKSKPFIDDDNDNGTPDNAWIVENLINGLHPSTSIIKTEEGSTYNYSPTVGIPLYTRFDMHKQEAGKKIFITMIYNIKQECKKYF